MRIRKVFGLMIDANLDFLMTDNLSHMEKVTCSSNSNKLTKDTEYRIVEH